MSRPIVSWLKKDSWRERLSWLRNVPQGTIARAVVLALYFGAIAVQELILEVNPIQLGIAFFIVTSAVGWWKWPVTLPGRAVFVGCGVVFTLSLLSEAPWISQLGVGILVLVLSVLGLLQRRRPLFQYLFLARFPLLLALLLIALPLLALGGPLTPVLGNLFVVGPWGALVLACLAVLASWVLMLTTRLIWSHAHRCGVEPWDPKPLSWALWKADRAKPPERTLLISSLLALPTLLVVVLRSHGPGAPWYLLAGSALAGVVLARGVFHLGYRLSGGPTAPDDEPTTENPLTRWLRAAPEDDDRLPSRRVVSGFFFATLWLYFGGYFLLHPQGSFSVPPLLYLAVTAAGMGWLVQRWPVWTASGAILVLYLAAWYFTGGDLDLASKVPALAYVLVLTILLGWLLSWISFTVDPHRVPTLPVVVVLPLVLYFIVDLDHYYGLVPPPETPAAESLSPSGVNPPTAVPRPASLRALPGTHPASMADPGSSQTRQSRDQDRREIVKATNARLGFWKERYGEEAPALVLVSASGGGITASLWTAHVFSRLQEECPGVLDAAHLISSVSGGGVGAMYVLDAYERGEQDFDGAVTKAGTSSLSASAWGLAYPDFWRSFSIRHPFDRMLDRAWAMERAWERTLGRDQPPTLAEWGDKAREGEMPVLLFNATVSETGERFLMPTLQLRSILGCEDPDGECDDGKETLETLHGGHDMSVVTAARLSATFPFVSPIARAWGVDPQDGRAFHIADGGYYDNFGVVSLVEWLSVLLEEAEPIKVVILEIRAYPSPPKERKARDRAGWLYASAGPLTTMLRVRTSSQMARNELEFRLIEKLGREMWDGKKFGIERIHFPLNIEDPPTSWQLSPRQKKDIQQYCLSSQIKVLREKVPGLCRPSSGVQVAQSAGG